MTQMQNMERDGGDSGGPVFYSNTAFGFYKGYHWSWFGFRDLYSKSTLLDNATGAHVATN